MRTRLLSAAVVFAFLAVLAGCSEAPTQEIQDAENALHNLESAGAAQYAPDELAAANDAMIKLKAEMAVQEKKNGLLRRYGATRELAVAARQAADHALTEVEAAKQHAREQAEAHITAARSLLDTVRPMLADAPRGKGSAADLKALEGDLAAVDSTLVSATAALQSGDYIAADAKATSAENAAGQVKAAIEQAKAMQAPTAKR